MWRHHLAQHGFKKGIFDWYGGVVKYHAKSSEKIITVGADWHCLEMAGKDTENVALGLPCHEHARAENSGFGTGVSGISILVPRREVWSGLFHFHTAQPSQLGEAPSAEGCGLASREGFWVRPPGQAPAGGGMNI